MTQGRQGVTILVMLRVLQLVTGSLLAMVRSTTGATVDGTVGHSGKRLWFDLVECPSQVVGNAFLVAAILHFGSIFAPATQTSYVAPTVTCYLQMRTRFS